MVRFRSGLTTSHPTGVVLGDLTDSNSEVQRVEVEVEAGDNGLNGTLLHPGEVLGIDGEAHDPNDDIILHPDHYLATHPGTHSFAQDLNNDGENALVTLSVFEANPDGSAGVNISNNFIGVNAGVVPEPETWGLLLGGLAGICLVARRRTCR